MESPSASPPDSPSSSDKRRARWIAIVSGVLCLLVMAAIVVYSKDAAKKKGGPSGPYLPIPGTQGGGRADPLRDTPWPDEDCAPNRERPPRVVFDLPPTGLDFGGVKQDVKVERDVVFRNEGSGPLCIRKVDVTCGCIDAMLVGEERVFAPGASGRIRVILDTKGREGDQNKTVSLYTNSFDVPRQTFAVRASISVGIVVSTGFLNFPRATVDMPSVGRVRLKSPRSDQEWSVTAVEGSTLEDGKPVAYTFTVDEVSDPVYHVRDIVVQHPGLSRHGLFTDQVTIRTTHPHRSQVKLTARLIVVPHIMTVPPRIVLGYVGADVDSTPRRVRLRPGADTVSFNVTAVRFEPSERGPVPGGGPGFVAEFGREEDGGWWADVQYDGAERPQGPLHATLVIVTDLAESPEIRVACSATVSPH